MSNDITHYFTGKACVRGHLDIRVAKSGACLACMRHRQRERLANDEAYRDLHRKSTLAYKLRVLADPVRKAAIRKRESELYSLSESRKEKKAKADRLRNQRTEIKDKRRSRQRAEYQTTLRSDADYKAKLKIRAAEWAIKNKDKCNAKTAVRRVMRNSALPRCLTAADRLEIESFYNRARKLTEHTGVPHEVDHIVPLKHPLVCGLHVPWNLQILTCEQNRSKGNKLIGV